MRACQIVAPGQPLRLVDLPDPSPGDGEVVVSITAAGMCRSDVHYRAGTRPVPSLPLVPGHEIAGVVSGVGAGVAGLGVGDRVCLHYLVTCGDCRFCRIGAEQFCETGEMLGLDRQGGYAQAIAVPARNAHRVPDSVSTEAAAVMMCSTATALHALRRARAGPDTTVGVFGAGGLGMSAIQVAFALGVERVVAVDINPVKLAEAADMGAIAVDGSGDPVSALRDVVPRGVDVGLELVGSAELMGTIVASLAPGGRAVAVGITHREFGLDPYRDLVRTEAEILGSADHLASEIDELLDLADRGSIDVDRLITRRIPLDLDAVESALVRLEGFGDDIRTVIVPG